MKNLTNRQQQVFDFIAEHIKRKRYPPTIREIATFFEISVKGAYDHVKALIRKGWLKSDSNRSRALELVSIEPEKNRIIEVPILGKVTAGIPLLAEENLDGYITLSSDTLDQEGIYFALTIRGESMKNAGIIEGDLGIFLHKSSARDGDIIVAMLDEEKMILKRYFKEKNRIRLQSENDAYAPTYCQEVRILGLLKRLVREYDN